VSPDWYGTPDQVPTWNSLSAAHEARLAPKPAWTRAKMSAGRFEGLLKAITGYELAIEALRGTRKLGQHKTETEQAGAAAGLAPFNPEMARLMREGSSHRNRGEDLA
jgi:transcriptional regulator